MYDVIVVGGGISGCMAAVAAARKGAKTLMIEQYGFPGGMLTAAGVGPMMSFHAGEKQVIQGLTGELINRLVALEKSPGHLVDTVGFTYTVTPFDIEWMKYELEDMLLESGCEILYHTMLAKATTTEGNITSITICNKGGLSELTARVFVDATGDADLAAWAGVEFTKGRAEDGLTQPMTLKIRMQGVDIEKVKGYIRAHPQDFPTLKGNTALIDQAPRLSIGGFHSIFAKACEAGELAHPFGGVLFFETNKPGEVIVNTTRISGLDGSNPWDLSKGEVEGRRQARILTEFLTKRVPGFEKAEMLYTGPNIGVRSTRQIKGLYTLTQEDLLTCRKFEDVIAHTGYPVDIHNPKGKGTIAVFPEWGDVYSIPYRCLVNDQVSNLITVGRSISATFEAQAAIRTTPTVGAIGHAGGVAAAITARESVPTVDISIAELQEILKQQGAYLEV